jgi:hypothetical protein
VHRQHPADSPGRPGSHQNQLLLRLSHGAACRQAGSEDLAISCEALRKDLLGRDGHRSTGMAGGEGSARQQPHFYQDSQCSVLGWLFSGDGATRSSMPVENNQERTAVHQDDDNHPLRGEACPHHRRSVPPHVLDIYHCLQLFSVWRKGGISVDR